MENRTEKQRESNLELFRVITMLMIVLHHVVVNSGLLSGGGPIRSDPYRLRSLITVVLGGWGKIGINCFVLISGYFMCRSKITLKKFMKLFLEYMFYKIALAAAFLITGYRGFTVKDFLGELIPISGIGTEFVPCYLIFFLCIPFLNLLTERMDESRHVLVMLLGLFTYSFLGFFRVVTMNYVSWFIVLYFVASYIRLYPKPIYNKPGFWSGALAVSVVISVLAILLAVKLRGRYGINNYYYFVADSNTPLALITAVCAFLFFKNLRVPQSRLINALGASSFGVLLLHPMGNTVRHLLWEHLFNVVHAYTHEWFYLFLLGTVLTVYIACTLIDMLRIRLLERPFFARWDRIDPSPEARLKALWHKIMGKIGNGVTRNTNSSDEEAKNE